MHPRNPPHISAFLNHQPEIDETAFIAPTAAVIGAVRIGAGSSIWYQVTLRGDNNFITIGTGTNIQDNSCVHISSCDFPTIIGDYVSIGHSALVHACRLEDHSFVGMRDQSELVLHLLRTSRGALETFHDRKQV